MRSIFLLCAALALSIATEPVEEVAAALEMHLDEEFPLRMLDGTEENEPLPEEEVGEKMQGDVNKMICRDQWIAFGSRCFGFYGIQKSWADAETFCLRKGANLASVHNGEYRFLQDLVKAHADARQAVWLGGTDAVQDFNWLWSDGSLFSFPEWNSDEPNNYGGLEKCIVMNQPDEHYLADKNCEWKFPFICGTKPVKPVAMASE